MQKHGLKFIMEKLRNLKILFRGYVKVAPIHAQNDTRQPAPKALFVQSTLMEKCLMLLT